VAHARAEADRAGVGAVDPGRTAAPHVRDAPQLSLGIDDVRDHAGVAFAGRDRLAAQAVYRQGTERGVGLTRAPELRWVDLRL